MLRPLALLALALALCSCGAAPPPAPAAYAPTVLPSVTPPPPSATAAPAEPPPPTAPPAPTGTPAAAAAPRYDLVLAGGTLIDATGGAVIENAAVAIAGGRIVQVGLAGTLAYSADTPVRDISGGAILPGLIDAHVHISGLSEEDLRGWTRAGVTTVRDLAGTVAERVPLRDSFAARGDASLPRLLVSGPIITVEGGYPFAVADPRLRVPAVAVRGPDDARAQVNALADAGVDLIKIAVSGRTDVSWPELSDAEIGAITAAAHARGLRVTAHIDRSAALRRAVLQGIDDVAHSPRDRVPDDLIALMVERGVTMAPTIAVYEGLALSRGRAVEWRKLTQPVLYDNLRRFAAAGGTLALGDDFGGVPGMPLGMPMAEIQHWLAAGLTPQQIIVAATRGSAIAAGVADQLGTIEPGKLADLLVVEGDPLSDLDALTRPILVLRSGQVVGP